MIPLTLVILLGLFLIQRKGTGGVGALFGPVMVLWFAVLAGLGGASVWKTPAVWMGLDPLRGLRFLLSHGFHGFLILGAVFLAITGGEALYADMGHFGKKPIRAVWFALVQPALLLNYFGQGALLLRDPLGSRNPFFLLAPPWALTPLVLLSAAAAVIASQAVISGAFSLTRQAVQLGFCPRVAIRHTSSEEIGQIYVPSVNRGLLAATILLVLAFRTSESLAAAYGVAVTTTMVITTPLFHVLVTRRWGWNRAAALPLTAAFLTADLSFFGANAIKIEHGGFVPLALSAAVFLLLSTWKRGRAILARRLKEESLPLELFLADIRKNPPLRVPGTAVFLTGNPTGVPGALLHNLKHNHVLHERVALLTVVTEDVPAVPSNRRLSLKPLGLGFFRMTGRFGFMETPSVPKLLALAQDQGFPNDAMTTTFFLGRESLVAGPRPELPRWWKELFALLSRNAQSATAFFGLPPNRVVELGTQIAL